MQDEHLLAVIPGEVMDDRSHDNAEQAKGGYIIRGCPWCEDDPEATHDDQCLKDETEALEVLIQHLEHHRVWRLLALSIATHMQNVSFHVIEP